MFKKALTGFRGEKWKVGIVPSHGYYLNQIKNFFLRLSVNLGASALLVAATLIVFVYLWTCLFLAAELEPMLRGDDFHLKQGRKL